MKILRKNDMVKKNVLLGRIIRYTSPTTVIVKWFGKHSKIRKLTTRRTEESVTNLTFVQRKGVKAVG